MEIIDAGRVRIGVSATRVSGRDYIDVRQFYTDERGILRPTSNGSLLPLECYEEIIRAMRLEYEHALSLEPATFYYFKELVEDKSAIRKVSGHRIFATAKEAVRKTPTQHGAEKQQGFIFRCSEYELIKGIYSFKPTKPFAVWNSDSAKWQRWGKPSKS